jgi:hypothetical protein
MLSMRCKIRMSASGVHLFDRVSGVNVLLDEVRVPAGRFSRAPRYLSIALTNACELRCFYCYAPKHAAALDRDRVLAWAVELDACIPRRCQARGRTWSRTALHPNGGDYGAPGPVTPPRSAGRPAGRAVPGR